MRPAGVHTVTWDTRDDAGRGLGTGIDFARLEAGSAVPVRRLLLLE